MSKSYKKRVSAKVLDQIYRKISDKIDINRFDHKVFDKIFDQVVTQVGRQVGNQVQHQVWDKIAMASEQAF